MEEMKNLETPKNFNSKTDFLNRVQTQSNQSEKRNPQPEFFTNESFSNSNNETTTTKTKVKRPVLLMHEVGKNNPTSGIRSGITSVQTSSRPSKTTSKDEQSNREEDDSGIFEKASEESSSQ